MMLIRGGKVLHGKHWRRLDILINDEGRIVSVRRSRDILPQQLRFVDTVINAKGLLVLPGLIDMHVHFREPSFEYKEDFRSGSMAAIAGGVTIVGDMPNNKPRIRTPELLKKKAKLIEGKSHVDYLLYAEMPGDEDTLRSFLDSEIKPRAIKVYFYIEEERELFLHGNLPREFLYIVHAEDPDFLSEPQDCESYISFLKSRPSMAELSAVRKSLKVAEKGIRVHFAHISTHEALSEILAAKRRGLPVSFEVAPHYIYFNAEVHGERLKSLLKCYPPIRLEMDRRALRNALRAGLIEAIATDHAPHSLEEKRRNLCDAPPGIASIQWLLPLMFTARKLFWVKDFRPILKALTEAPAKILGLKDVGKIKAGYWANLVLFDPTAEYRIRYEGGYSKAKVGPYEGMLVKGRVEAVILRGKLVYNKGSFLSASGKFI